MSSSPKLAPRTAGRESKTESCDSQSFPYEVLPAGIIGNGGSDRRIPSSVQQPNNGGPDEAMAREAEQRSLGRQEGRAEAWQQFEQQLERERSSISSALARFAEDRAEYFQSIEAEVVQLALAIARKILRREAQLDPLLLAGIVRVALEKIDGATDVRLRLHPQNAPGWRQYFADHLAPENLPEIVEDSAQSPGTCVLETSMGKAVLGMEVQLKEIEQGLMDLLAARPEAKP